MEKLITFHPHINASYFSRVKTIEGKNLKSYRKEYDGILRLCERVSSIYDGTYKVSLTEDLKEGAFSVVINSTDTLDSNSQQHLKGVATYLRECLTEFILSANQGVSRKVVVGVQVEGNELAVKDNNAKRVVEAFAGLKNERLKVEVGAVKSTVGNLHQYLIKEDIAESKEFFIGRIDGYRMSSLNLFIQEDSGKHRTMVVTNKQLLELRVYFLSDTLVRFNVEKENGCYILESWDLHDRNVQSGFDY